MQPTAKGGPITEAGKQVSSRNAISHGLTAKKWINSQEQQHYQDYLNALLKDYQPQSVMEETLIEKLAETTVRIARFHNVEDNLFCLAREQSASPERVIESFDLEDKELADDFAQHQIGLLTLKAHPSETLYAEIIANDKDQISGWQYVEDNMPQLKAHIFEECRKEKRDVQELLGGLTDQENRIPPLKITAFDSDNSQVYSDEKLSQSVFALRRTDLVEYIKDLLKTIRRRMLLNILIDNYEQRSELLKTTALPDTATLDRINRYRTTLERQFSKTLGELLHIIKIRED